MEKHTGKIKKTQTPKEEADMPKDVSGERASGKKPSKRRTLVGKQSKAGLSPEDEEHLFDASDTSFEDDFEGVPVFIPFQRKNPYECGKCGRIFRHKMGCIHTGKKPSLCSQCGKAFRHSSDITKHQRVHTGEKPVSCGQCGKAFRHSLDITKHQRVHTGEKPVSCGHCGQCGKAFSCGSNVRRHQKTHVGEKPYECRERGKAFADSSCLMRHQEHHPRRKH
ncbi:LOW QUALITY PROTEIN: zinc finger protein 41 homolog [Trichechus inunguis]